MKTTWCIFDEKWNQPGYHSDEDIDAQDLAILQSAGDIIKNGDLVAFPTETVYGLGGDALNPMSSQKIYQAKGRPSDNPLIVHIANMDDLEKIAIHIPKAAWDLANKFWPGPFTMVLHKSPLIPYETTGGLETVAIRFPNHPLALELIKHSGGFVAAPSANTSGRPSPTLGKYVYEDMEGKIPMLLDSGAVGLGVESTIVDMTCNPPMLLRPGSVTREMLLQMIPDLEMDHAIMADVKVKAPKAPGMKYRHYAPKAQMSIICGKQADVVKYINQKCCDCKIDGMKTAVITTEEMLLEYQADCIKSLGSRLEYNEIAKQLFRVLRELDEEKVDIIFSESFEEAGIGQAVMNRLKKAAGHRIIKLEKKD